MVKASSCRGTHSNMQRRYLHKNRWKFQLQRRPRHAEGRDLCIAGAPIARPVNQTGGTATIEHIPITHLRLNLKWKHIRNRLHNSPKVASESRGYCCATKRQARSLAEKDWNWIEEDVLQRFIIDKGEGINLDTIG